MEGQAEHAHEEVNGVAGEVALRPAPIAVLDDEAGIGRQNKIACLAGDELESAFAQSYGRTSRTGPFWSQPAKLR